MKALRNKKFDAVLLGLFVGCISCGIAANAKAQTTIYGVVDTGVEYVNNTNSAGNAMFRMPSLTGSVPSRIGFKGSENLGTDLSVLFVLETGLAPDSGSLGQGGRLFGRQSYVGLKTSYGSITLGRQPNMTFLSYMKADVMGPNIHGMSNMDGYLPNARSDNAIAYLGKFAELSIGATYSSGRDSASSGGPSATNCAGEIAGNPLACRQFTALLAYDSERYGFASAYDKLYGGPNALAGLNSSHYFVERWSLNGYRWIGKTKIGAGWIQRKTQAAQLSTANLYYLGVSQPLDANWIVDSQVSYLGVQNISDSSIQLSTRLSYQLSKRTTIYGSLAHINNKGAAAIAVSAGASVGAGMSQSSVMTGIRHSF